VSPCGDILGIQSPCERSSIFCSAVEKNQLVDAKLYVVSPPIDVRLVECVHSLNELFSSFVGWGRKMPPSSLGQGRDQASIGKNDDRRFVRWFDSDNDIAVADDFLNQRRNPFPIIRKSSKGP
jgi:hypothetical protein